MSNEFKQVELKKLCSTYKFHKVWDLPVIRVYAAIAELKGEILSCYLENSVASGERIM